MPKLVKNFSTPAEKAGLPSVKDIERQVSLAKGERPKRSKAPAPEAPSQQVIYVQMPPFKKERKKRILTDEQKEALRERLVRAREAKAQRRAPAEAV